MPWHLSEDLKRFKALTMGHTMIMGRKTWESLGRLLTGRRHVIVSRKPGYAVQGATVVASLDEAIAACASEAEIFVIGGGDIYRMALPLADRLYVTEIDAEFHGDTFFPPIPTEIWRETARQTSVSAAQKLPFAFVTYECMRTHGNE